jgi:hypothetical protein
MFISIIRPERMSRYSEAWTSGIYSRPILRFYHVVHCKKSVLKIQECIHEGANLKLFLNFSILSYWFLNIHLYTGFGSKLQHTFFFYSVYNSRLFNGFNNCCFWSLIVVITLGKCAHRTPAGFRERHTCIGLILNYNFIWQRYLRSWTSAALNMCELNTT